MRATILKMTDWLVLNATLSNISAISWHVKNEIHIKNKLQKRTYFVKEKEQSLLVSESE
jgi:hypothetical protein